MLSGYKKPMLEKFVSTKLKFGIIKVHKFGIINISISSKQESRPEYQK